MNIRTTRTAAVVCCILTALLMLFAATEMRRQPVIPPQTPIPSRPLLITCEVKPLGADEWSHQIKALDGDTVRWRIHVKNESGETVENLCVRDILPTGMTYVPGSTTLANSTNPDGMAVSDRIIEDAGINLGGYAPGGDAWIYFNATVNRAALETEGSVILRNVAQTSGGSVTGTTEACADVIVDA